MDDLGNLFVIAAPSGTGKTTLVNAIIDSTSNIIVSISHTTRTKRPNEIHEKNYYYINKNQFEQLIDQGEFLEYATIFDHYYGTSKKWVNETLAKGTDVILEIDWQGNKQIKQIFPKCISIFILPPSLQDLKDRLIKRNQDHPEIIKKRIADAQETVRHIEEFDYIVVNDHFETALNDLKIIVQAGRLLEHCQTKKYTKLINELKNQNYYLN